MSVPWTAGEDSYDSLKPFAHEVNLLNDLSHENVVEITGFVEDLEHGVTWMVFPWERNGNLREFIRSAKWELPERLSVVMTYIYRIPFLYSPASR